MALLSFPIPKTGSRPALTERVVTQLVLLVGNPDLKTLSSSPPGQYDTGSLFSVLSRLSWEVVLKALFATQP